MLERGWGVNQSHRWDEFSKLSPEEIKKRCGKEIQKEGFPDNGDTFTLILSDGSRKDYCWVDRSTQYRAEGLCWRKYHDMIDRYCVVAWKMEE